jgi:hypothetical protein
MYGALWLPMQLQRAKLGTQVHTWGAGRAPRSGSKSAGRRGVYKALEAIAAGHHSLRAVLEPTRQFQPIWCVRYSRLLAHAAPRELSAACSASGEKSSSRSNHDFDSLACTASKHSIAWNAGQGSSRTYNQRIAGATTSLLPEIRIIFSISCCLDSTGVRRVSQEFAVSDIEE